MLGLILSLALAQTFPTDGIPFSLTEITGQTSTGASWDALIDLANEVTALNDHVNSTTLDTNTIPNMIGTQYNDDNYENYDWLASDSEWDQDAPRILAKAILYVKDPSTYSSNGTTVRDYCYALIGTQLQDDTGTHGSNGVRALRSLFAYASAADYVWRKDGSDGTGSDKWTATDYTSFRNMLFDYMEPVDFDGQSSTPVNGVSGRSLVEYHLERPNNLGTAAGASVLAICIAVHDISGYAPDSATYAANARNCFRAWCGNTAVHPNGGSSPFDWDSNDQWQHTITDADKTCVGPVSSTFYYDTFTPKRSSNGCLPEEMRRWTDAGDPRCTGQVDDGDFTWNWRDTTASCAATNKPPRVNYCYEALQGACLQALLVQRLQYTVSWTAQSSAISRAIDWLWEKPEFYATDNDCWVIALAGQRYSRSDWDDEVDFNFKPGRAISGVEWIVGK